MMVNKAMKTGINMAGDVASEVPFKQSIKRQYTTKPSSQMCRHQVKN